MVIQPLAFPAMVAGVAAVVISAAAIARFRDWAIRRRLIDVANPRSLHSGAVPRGAGAIIVLVTIGGLAAVSLIAPAWPAKRLLPYLTGAMIVAGVSWLDDLRSLSPAVRFAAHFVAASVMALGEAPYGPLDVPLVGPISLGWLGIPIAVAWIVWMTNAFNFMDGADALAGLQAVVAGLGWVLFGMWVRDAFLVVTATLTTGASVGFLRHNWPPARVFMGDVGSAFLGYTFASFAVIGWTVHPSLAIAGALMLWPFFFDAAFTLARRLWRGERVWEAHRSHLYQRSIARGARHADVAIEYAVTALCGMVTAIAWVSGFDPRGIAVPCVSAASALWLWTRMTAREKAPVQVSPHA